MNLREYLSKYKRKRIISILRNSSSEKFEKIAIKKLFKAFNSLYKTSPAYRKLLEKENINPQEIRTEKDFCTKLPILRKQNFFEPFSLHELLGNKAERLKLATSSSGFSGIFAYGYTSARTLAIGQTGVDATLDYWFDISHRKTFLINCAPMGVHIDTSLPIAETSVRSDMALSLIKKVSTGFDQTIIVGDPYFLKKLIEEGTAQKINWRKSGISLITGQDWLPESLRSYLAHLIEIDPETEEQRGIFATMGMTELGLNVFHESKYTVRLRRRIFSDKWLRESLVNSEMKSSPVIFHYYPFRTYIETVKSGDQNELLFSVTDENSLLPLMRYSTGDCGSTITYKEFSDILKTKYPELIPDLKLPIGLMYGRLKSEFAFHGRSLFIEDIKEGLYANFEVASNITGYISLKANNESAELFIQLKKSIKKRPALEESITKAANSFLTIEIQVRVFEFYEMPDILELNYERKFSAL